MFTISKLSQQAENEIVIAAFAQAARQLLEQKATKHKLGKTSAFFIETENYFLLESRGFYALCFCKDNGTLYDGSRFFMYDYPKSKKHIDRFLSEYIYPFFPIRQYYIYK